MYFVFVVFMGLILAFVAYPLARAVGWRYGRFGRTTDMVFVIIAALIGAVLFTVIAGAIGAAINGDVGALIGGFIGAMLAVGALVIFSAKATYNEPNRAKPPLPGEDTPA